MYFPKKIKTLLITWFGCGWVPVAPGTAGSVGALPLCWLFGAYATIYERIVFAIGMTCIAIIAAAQECIENPEIRDPGYIVIDEVAGMLWSTIALTAVWPSSWLSFLIAFVLFRIFDVVKPYPARFFDQCSKTSPSAFRRGMHIVLDDVVAGLYAAIVLNALTLLGIIN